VFVNTMFLKGEPFDNWPIKIVTKECNTQSNYWFSKAGVKYEKNGKEGYIFGFGCSKDKESSETSAYFECLEHIFGLPYSYNDSFILKNIDTYSYITNKKLHSVTRNKLLIGSKLKKSKRNATGLAVGITKKKAIDHAMKEVIERHLSYHWWLEDSFSMKLLDSKQSKNTLTCLFYTEGLGYHYTVNIEISHEPSIVTFGSSVAKNKSDAISHAIEERIMLNESLTNTRKLLGESKTIESIRPKYKLLLDSSFKDIVWNEVISKIKLEKKIEETSVINIIEELTPSLEYAVIFSTEQFYLVRCYSDISKDASLYDAKIITPFV